MHCSVVLVSAVHRSESAVCIHTSPPSGPSQAHPSRSSQSTQLSSLCFIQVALVVKNPPANARDTGLIPWWGRSPGGGHGNPPQYSCLENSMDRGAWWAMDHRVAESRTHTHRYRCILTHTHTHTHTHTELALPPAGRHLSGPNHHYLLVVAEGQASWESFPRAIKRIQHEELPCN